MTLVSGNKPYRRSSIAISTSPTLRVAVGNHSHGSARRYARATPRRVCIPSNHDLLANGQPSQVGLVEVTAHTLLVKGPPSAEAICRPRHTPTESHPCCRWFPPPAREIEVCASTCLRRCQTRLRVGQRCLGARYFFR